MERIIKQDITEHGNYMYGTLDSVDFTEAGVMVDEKTGKKTPFGDSVKLKFLMDSVRLKKLGGVDVEQKSTNSYVVSIPCTASDLPEIYSKYLKLEKTDMFITYYPSNNFGFKVISEDKIKLVQVK